MGKLNAKDLISIKDLKLQDIHNIFDLASELKTKLKNGEPHRLLEGKTLAMIFEKPSCRTRVSFEVGMFHLGGKAINLAPEDIQLGIRESVADIARTLSRYVDGIMIRSFSHRLVEELAEYATVPVINGLTDLSHPCQALSDVFTIFEKKGELKRIKVAYVGDGNNVCHSLLFASAKLGFDLSVASPKGYEPSVEVLRLVKGAKILNDPKEVVVGADVVYTDVWASMGQEAEAEKRALDFKDFQVNSDLLDLAKKDAMVMHCLPAHRGEEITDDVIDGPQSVVFDQAENRLHVQKAILALLIGA